VIDMKAKMIHVSNATHKSLKQLAARDERTLDGTVQFLLGVLASVEAERAKLEEK
jgi:hypothetical protein